MWLPNVRGIKALRGNVLIVSYMVVCGIAFMMFGFDQAVLGGLASSPGFLKAIDTTNSLIIGCVIALFAIGAIFGSAAAVVYGYRFGRRWLIFVGCSLLVIGAILQTSAFSLAQMVVGRTIAGFGVGLMSSTVPVLLSEIAKPQSRGKLVAALFTLGVGGIALAEWMIYGVLKNSTNEEYIWRFPVAFQCFFGVFAMIFIFFLPESPRWLYSQGYHEDAYNVLARVYNTTEHSDLVRETSAAMKTEVEEENAHEDKGFQLFLTCMRAIFWDTTELRLGKRLRLCMIIMMLQEMSGLNVIVAYSSTLFADELGFTPLRSVMVSAIIQLGFASFTVPAMFSIERWGRRPTLMLGTIICTGGMIGFTVSIAIGTESSGWAGMVMLILFFLGFAFGMLPISWLYPAEVLPLHMRHVGEGVAGIVSWLFTFLTVFTGPVSIENTGWRIFILYIIFNALAFPFAYFMMVETKDKTLEEVNHALSAIAPGGVILGRSNGIETVQESEKTSAAGTEKGIPV